MTDLSEWKMDSIIIHTIIMLFHIAMHILSSHCMSQDWKWAKDHLIIINFYACYTTHSHSTQVSCPTQASRLASRDHLLCMMNLACNRVLESVYLQARGRGQSGNSHQECLAT